jgi:hypothetical protein
MRLMRVSITHAEDVAQLIRSAGGRGRRPRTQGAPPGHRLSANAMPYQRSTDIFFILGCGWLRH